MNPQTNSSTATPSSIKIPAAALQKDKYMRTYAMDFARLSQQAQQQPIAEEHEDKKGFFDSLKTSLHGQAAPAPTPAPAPSEDESLIVHESTTRTPELSDLERDAELRDARAADAEKEISAELSKLAPQQAEAINLPPVQASPASQTTISPSRMPQAPQPQEMPRRVEEDDSSRESILERLKQRAAQQSSYKAQTLEPIRTQKIQSDSKASIQTPQPPVVEKEQVRPIVEPPPLPQPTYIPPPKPIVLSRPPVETAPAPVPTPARAPIPESLPTAQPIQQPIVAAPAPSPISKAEPAPFHSFSSDFAQRVDTQRASTFSVLAAEKDTRAPTPAPKKRNIELLPVLAGLVLIVGGGVGVLLAYNFMHQNTAPIVAPTESSFITADEKISLASSNWADALAAQSAQAIPDGEVVYAVLPKEASSTAQSQLLQLGFQAPDIVLRNITDIATGVVHAGSETRPYFALKVASYDRTFVGMLNWELTMSQNLALFYPEYSQNAPVSTTTPATVTTSFPSPGLFTDDIVASHSVRILRDTQGRSLMLYGYTADKQILIIARDEAAFTLLLNRLSTTTN